MVDTLKNDYYKAIRTATPVEPEPLINALSSSSEPMAYIWGDCPELYETSQSALGHIDLYRTYVEREIVVPPELTEQVFGTINWMLIEVENFENSQENSRVTLAAIFDVCARWSQISEFWGYVPRDKISPDFCNFMRDILEKVVCITDDASAPLWERELMLSIADADASQRWSILAEHWKQFEHVVRPNYLCSEASRFLYAYDLNGLCRIVDNMTTMWDILLSVQRLTAEEKLHLASLSESARARFVLVQDALFHLPKDEVLNEQESEYLERTLTKVNSCSQEWKEWMGAFNKYPSRAPQMQAALGRVLSNGSHDSLCSYINAISLYHDHNASRLQVTDCLKIFRENASLEKRQELWKIAFDRWEHWDFGISTGGVTLTQVSWSQIDFAVIGYFVEVLDPAELEGRRSNFMKVFLDMQFEWWNDIVSLIHNYNREISKFALFLDPKTCATGWSLPTTFCLPHCPHQDRYTELTFNP